MKKAIFLSAIIFLLTISCKKSNKTSSPGNTTSTTGYYAILSTGRLQSVSSGTLSAPFNNCGAYFSNVPATSTNSATAVKVNSVSLNGTIFQYSSNNYNDTTFSISFPPSTWIVNGASGIPTFTYTNNDPMPAFTGYGSLPDTIYRNQNTTLHITGITGADLITVFVEDGTKGVTQGMPVTASSVTFPTSSLSTLSATNYGTILVLLDKSNVQTIGGKSMNFIGAYQLNKTVVIK
ncbi:MAG TPA: hypothetical protein VNY73_09975 [Bacteroidia bacterium]|jgi:hypothetical protein|nr:hypothetical protein [Bacteroidia bacterium]